MTSLEDDGGRPPLDSLDSIVTLRRRSKSHPLVLEVGAGHRPSAEADILVDRYLDPVERTGPLDRAGKPFVQAAGEQLPFAPNIFGFCIAKQVLEHSTDIEAFARELSRVARGGLIETPSPLAELLLRQRAYHRWIVSRGETGLLYWPRSALPTYHLSGDVLETLYTRNLPFYLAIQSQHSLFLTTYRWFDEINIRSGVLDELHAAIHRSVELLSTQSKLRQAAQLARLLGQRFARRSL